MFRRAALTIVLACAALAPAACGGSSTLSTSQYESQGVKALTPVLNALNSLKANPTSAAGWEQLQSASATASSTFSKLNVSGAISSVNSQLVSSLADMGKAAGKLGTDISSRSVSAARVDLASYQAALQRYGKAITALGAKGVRFLSGS